MVRRNQIDRAVSQSVPQAITMQTATNRRRAFERGSAIRNLIGGKREVVRTRFYGDRHTIRPGRDKRRDRVGRREMDDVNMNVEITSEMNEQVDGGVLRDRRAAVEPGRVVSRVAIRDQQMRWQFGVHQKRQAE